MCSLSESESSFAGLDSWSSVNVSVEKGYTHFVVELDSLDDFLVGIEQSPNVLFLLDELDVSDDSSSSGFGLVQVVLDFGTFGQALVLSVDMLQSQLCPRRCERQLTLQELTKLLAH